MGKIIETKIERFDGGISNDPRDPRSHVFRMVSNHNITTNPRKASPYRSTENGNTNQSTDTIRNFAVGRSTGTTYRLFGLGRVSGASARAEVLVKDLTSSAANDLDDSDWATLTNGSGGAGTLTSFDLFVFYRQTGRLYGARDGSNIWACLADDTSAFEDSDGAVTYTHIGQGLVHSKDDILYFPYYNNGGAAATKSFIASKNGSGAWNFTALTLPDHLVPVSICEFGNYLAIGCAPASGEGDSVVYLWDRNATLSTLAESVNWGPDILRILEYVDGELVGISQSGGAVGAVQPGSGSTVAGGVSPRTTTSLQDRVIFRRLEGNRAVKFLELTRDGDITNVGSTRIPIAKQRVGNRLFFTMLIEFGGVVRDGIFSIGRNELGEWTLINEQTSNNDSALATGDTIENFFVLDDFRFVVYQTAAGTWTMTKTNEGATAFSHYSILETKRYNGGDSSLRRDLIGVTVTHEPLPANASVEVWYRADASTSWTQIVSTDSTDNDISHSAVNIESSGAALPKDYKEIEFRIRSTGGASGEGAEITGFSFQEDITGKRNYGALWEYVWDAIKGFFRR